MIYFKGCDAQKQQQFLSMHLGKPKMAPVVVVQPRSCVSSRSLHRLKLSAGMCMGQHEPADHRRLRMAECSVGARGPAPSVYVAPRAFQ